MKERIISILQDTALLILWGITSIYNIVFPEGESTFDDSWKPEMEQNERDHQTRTEK